MLDKSKIIEQVKKLLEVNQSNGATESEEKIALEKANMLIEKYQIEKYQLKSKSSNTHEYFTPKKKYPIYDWFLWYYIIIQVLFCVFMFIRMLFNINQYP